MLEPNRDQTIKVGILHSLTGTMAVSEYPVKDAVMLAISEINREGGLLGKTVEAVIEDGASDSGTFAEKARKLIVEDRVCAVFGGWTSSSRKMMLPVFEELNSLLFYPVQYEGMEQSPNIFYTGATTNQQIIPAVDWLLKNKGKSFYLLGSDYIFPRTANQIVKKQLQAFDGKLIGEEYTPLGHADFKQLVRHIKDAQPEVIFNTLNGDSNSCFFQELSNAGITSKDITVLSVSIAEGEVQNIGAEWLEGHLTAWNYFQSYGTRSNQTFVRDFKAAFGEERVTSDPMEAAYTAVHLWAKMVIKAGTTNTDNLRNLCGGIAFDAPQGRVWVDGDTQHIYKKASIGEIMRNGMIKPLWTTPESIQPDPFLKTYKWADIGTNSAQSSLEHFSRKAIMRTLFIIAAIFSCIAVIVGVASTTISQTIQYAEPASLENAQQAMNSGIIMLCTIGGLVFVLSTATVVFLHIKKQSANKQLIHYMQQIGEGRLQASPPEVNDKNGEAFLLVEAARQMVGKLQTLIRHTSEASRKLTEEAQQLSIQSKSTMEAAATITKIIINASDQAGHQQLSATEMAATMSEIAAAIQFGAVRMNQVSEHALKSDKLAVSGIDTIENAFKKAGQVSLASRELDELVQQMQNQAGEIGAIIKGMNELAEQTNILALNAGIEAVRVGEAGKGFAVIAKEIRRMADLSQSSAAKIGSLIVSMRSQTEQVAQHIHLGIEATVQSVHQGGDMFQSISSAVRSVAEQVEETSSTYEQMSASTDQVHSLAEAQRDMAKSSAEQFQEVVHHADLQQVMISQISSSANTLYRIAEDLQQSVSQLRI